MLVLSRKVGERIVVPGCGLTITVVEVRGKRVRLAMAAPNSVVIHREEVWLRDEWDDEDQDSLPLRDSSSKTRAPR